MPALHQLCTCGKTLGKHRIGDNACPNPAWRCGNGHSQWLTRIFAAAVKPPSPFIPERLT